MTPHEKLGIPEDGEVFKVKRTCGYCGRILETVAHLFGNGARPSCGHTACLQKAFADSGR